MQVFRGVLRFQPLAYRAMSSVSSYNYETLLIKNPSEYVFQVHMNRPEKRNSMNRAFWREIKECFDKLGEDSECRAIVLSAEGPVFSAGLDMMEVAQDLLSSQDMEVGRRAIVMSRLIRSFQSSFTSLEKCLKPVIAAVQGACVGGGIDMITAADIRYCTKDAWFSIKEVDIGLAADVGTLQRLPKITGNDSLTRELVYTGRRLDSDEAMKFGLVSRIFDNHEAMVEAALSTASLIAEKSPIAVQGSKSSIVYARDHSVSEGLEQMVTWNQGMLQSEDLIKAATAAMSKEKPDFAKL